MNNLYRLGDFEIDVQRRQLRLGDESVSLSGKPFEVLLALLDRAGRVVTKEELMEAVWANAFVEEANLTQSISVLRKAFGEKSTNARYIITVQGRGYQLGVTPEPVGIAVSSSVAYADAEIPKTDPVNEPPVTSSPKRPGPRMTLWITAVCLVLVIMLAFGFIYLHRRRPSPFSHIATRRLTNSGDVQTAAISPTGRYLAWVSRGLDGKESASVSDLKNGGSQVLFPSTQDPLRYPAFSPDEAFVYVQTKAEKASPDLWVAKRIPLLGGEPVLVVRDVDGPLTFIDRGTHLCFARGSGDGKYSFISSDLDGGTERTLGQRSLAEPTGAECSPDGQRAAFSSEVSGLQILDFKSGKTSSLSDLGQQQEIFRDAVWNPKGDGLVAGLVTPFDMSSSLHFVAFPAGSNTAITHDLDSYRNPSLTNDGKQLVAVQRDTGLEFRSFDLPLPGIDSKDSTFRWSGFLGWLNDETLVGSGTDGTLKQTDVTTGHERPIPTPHGMKFLQPNGCGSGAIIATGSRFPDRALNTWYMRMDGSELRQLSHGKEDILPACTPDGKWVVYADNSNLGSPAVYRVAPEGGQPQKLESDSVWFALSPDGTRFAWFETGKAAGSALAVADLVSGNRLATIALPAGLVPHRSLTWSSDNQHVFFAVHSSQSDAVWQIGSGGSGPVKVIQLSGHYVAALMTSPNGKRLGMVTAKPQSDAVLFEDLDR